MSCQQWSGTLLASVILSEGREGLHVVTQVAAFHILHYIAAHAQPPEAACYQVRHLPLARVTHYWGVVEGGHYVVSELTIWGDIDSTSIEYQAILSAIPCDVSLCQCSALSGL